MNFRMIGYVLGRILLTEAVLMLFPLLDMAHRVYVGKHTFDDLGMDAYTPQEDKV